MDRIVGPEPWHEISHEAALDAITYGAAEKVLGHRLDDDARDSIRGAIGMFLFVVDRELDYTMQEKQAIQRKYSSIATHLHAAAEALGAADKVSLAAGVEVNGEVEFCRLYFGWPEVDLDPFIKAGVPASALRHLNDGSKCAMIPQLGELARSLDQFSTILRNKAARFASETPKGAYKKVPWKQLVQKLSAILGAHDPRSRTEKRVQFIAAIVEQFIGSEAIPKREKPDAAAPLDKAIREILSTDKSIPRRKQKRTPASVRPPAPRKQKYYEPRRAIESRR